MGIVEQAIEKQKLLDMKLHGSTSLNKWVSVLRVYGGWIYQFNCPPEEGTDYGVFVPEELNCNTKAV